MLGGEGGIGLTPRFLACSPPKADVRARYDRTPFATQKKGSNDYPLPVCIARLRRPSRLAERVGFEPTVPVRARRFSRPLPSTARSPLHNGMLNNISHLGKHVQAQEG